MAVIGIGTEKKDKAVMLAGRESKLAIHIDDSGGKRPSVLIPFPGPCTIESHQIPF